MYEDCEICGKHGDRVKLFGGASWADLCTQHLREFDEWAVNYPPWTEALKVLSELGIFAAHAQGGRECAAQMRDLAARRQALSLELHDAARAWAKDKAAEAQVAKKD